MDLSQGNTSDSMLRQSTNFCRLSFFCSILLPYIPLPMRQPLLLFSKFIELKECMACPKQQFDFGQTKTADPADAISDILAKLSPLLSETERAQLSQMQNMMQMLKLYQTFQELAPFMNMGGDSPFPFPFYLHFNRCFKVRTVGRQKTNPLAQIQKVAAKTGTRTKPIIPVPLACFYPCSPRSKKKCLKI